MSVDERQVMVEVPERRAIPKVQTLLGETHRQAHTWSVKATSSYCEVSDILIGQTWEVLAQPSSHPTQKIPIPYQEHIMDFRISTSAFQHESRTARLNPTSTLAHQYAAPTSQPQAQIAATSVPSSHPRKENSDEELILKLCCFLGDAPVPYTLLQRGGVVKLRWDRLGEVKKLTPVEAGVDPEIAVCLADEVRRIQAIENLKSSSWIQPQSTNFTFIVGRPNKCQMMNKMDSREKDYWARQACNVVVQGFPRPFLDPE